jgi:hypothetical protein
MDVSKPRNFNYNKKRLGRDDITKKRKKNEKRKQNEETKGE